MDSSLFENEQIERQTSSMEAYGWMVGSSFLFPVFAGLAIHRQSEIALARCGGVG